MLKVKEYIQGYEFQVNTALIQNKLSAKPIALTHQACLRINTPGFRTQLAQPEQLAFVKVTLVGEGITTPITQDGDKFLPLPSF